MILAKKAGNPAPKLEQFSLESVVYTFDLREILEPIELATKVDAPVHDGIIVTGCRSLGTIIEVRIIGAPLDTAQYKDYNIQVPFHTNMNNIRAVTFTLRIHK